jgi:hypothetical protein
MFLPRTVRVGFVVDEVALIEFVHRILLFVLFCPRMLDIYLLRIEVI